MASTVVWSISSPEVRLAKIIFLSARVMNLIKNQQITTSTPVRYKGETAENINDPVCSLTISAAKAIPVIHIKTDSGFIKASKRILSCHPIKILGGGEGYDPVVKNIKVKK